MPRITYYNGWTQRQLLLADAVPGNMNRVARLVFLSCSGQGSVEIAQKVMRMLPVEDQIRIVASVIDADDGLCESFKIDSSGALIKSAKKVGMNIIKRTVLDSGIKEIYAHRTLSTIALVALFSKKGCTVSEAAEQLNRDKTSIRMMLHNLQKDGLVTREGTARKGKRYQSTMEGLLLVGETMPHFVAMEPAYTIWIIQELDIEYRQYGLPALIHLLAIEEGRVTSKTISERIGRPVKTFAQTMARLEKELELVTRDSSADSALIRYQLTQKGRKLIDMLFPDQTEEKQVISHNDK